MRIPASCLSATAFVTLSSALPFAAAAPSAPTATGPVTVFIEAETGAPPSPAPVPRGVPAPPPATVWTAKDMAGASGGKTLFFGPVYRAPESTPLMVAIPRAGRYRVWVRYFKKTPAAANLLALLRNETSEVVGFSFLDYQSVRVPTETPYAPPASIQAGKSGFVWESFDVTFERPMRAGLAFGGGSGERHFDCVLVTNDMDLDPAKTELGKLSALATSQADATLPLLTTPTGFTRSSGHTLNPGSFAGVEDPDKRFWAGLINNGSYFVDGAAMIRMGFNRDHGAGVGARWGIPSMMPVENFADTDFKKAHPAPEGRFINAKGEVGQGFSLHYRPFVEAADEQLKSRIAEAVKNEDGTIGFWRISAEEGGWLDYSSYAIEAFRKWLEAKHGAIQTLNAHWGSKYAGFSDISPAKAYADDHACWLEFREFSGLSYAQSVGRRIPIIKAIDPKRRPCLGANSNLDIAAPYFLAFRPNDFEELIRTGLKDEKYVAFDIYCADDDMGSSIELLTSFAQGRKLINQEFSNHVVDPRIAARTYWMQVGKGVHGIHLFMVQDNTGHATYPKWGLQAMDGRPKEKLAAYSDAVQEVHRLEPLLMSAKYTHAVKPVALYWSRIDLGLDQPHDSYYGHALNSPIHVYETLRAAGYPVRWITPRQITEGELHQVGALVMAGSNHVPQAAAQRIEAWVKEGGAIVADSWPGAFDEYGQAQITMAPIFGVRPAIKVARGQPGSSIALQESRQGYGEVTDAAVLRERYFEKIDEIAQQPGATHPVARALGDFMVAGVYPDNVECFAGKVVGMSHRGKPGFVVNAYGKGQALYSSMLLGTIYEAAPTRYEWDTTHAGLSYHRLIDAFLKFAGARPAYQVNGLTPRIAAKLRVESPLVTPDGNVLIGLTSMNDDVVKPFGLEVELPPGAGPFTKVLIVTGGGRAMQPVHFRHTSGTLSLTMSAFDTHAMILALKDSPPLVGLRLTAGRGPAGLAVVKPKQEFTVEATVINPSSRVVAAGQVRLTLPVGWLQSAQQVETKTIPAGGEARCTFRVQAPQVAGSCRLEPLLARFTSGAIKSTPATEMVWWGLKSSAS